MNAIEYIKSNLSEDKIISVLEKHGAKKIRMLGDTYRCTCPIHGGDNDTAFSYNPENNLWCCFTECGGGDIFTLVAMLNDIDMENNFKLVITTTAQELGLDINGMDIGKHTVSYKEEMNKWLRYALKRHEIFNNPYDLSRLGVRYGLKEFRGISNGTLVKFGVGYLKEINRYIFPIFNEDNITIGASLRAVGKETPKWLHKPKSIKTGHILYNLHHCVEQNYRTVYVVEGIIDVLRLYDLGIDNVVCTFGARITEEQKMIIIKHFDKIILAFDNDEAGKKATLKSIDSLRKIIGTHVLLIPEQYKDVGDFKSICDMNECEVLTWVEYLQLKGGK